MHSTTTFSTWEEAVGWLRSQSDKLDVVRAAYYDDPLVEAADRYWSSSEWQAIRTRLPSARGSALDIGAGRGIASYALAKDGFAVTALEPDPSALVGAAAIRRLGEQSGLPIAVTQEFSERLPFGDNSFDVVFARAVLHHTSDLRAACSEFHRVLKPGGLMIAVREHVISRQEDLPVFLDAHPLHRYYGGENAFLLSAYLDAIRGAGFGIKDLLAPFDSPINMAPHTERGIQAQVASRLASAVPFGGLWIESAVMRLPWAFMRRMLNWVDARPGRLYSFVCTKA